MSQIAKLKQMGKEKTYPDLRMEYMTGKEKYPVIGKRVTQAVADVLVSTFQGLLLMGDCEKKALIIKEFLMKTNEFELVHGSFRCWSGDYKSAYGFDWNPPWEVHFWLENSKHEVIDFSLPGVILRGLTTRDEVGPYLVNREPVILAGSPPKWLIYERR